jgi:hypothetical protein
MDVQGIRSSPSSRARAAARGWGKGAQQLGRRCGLLRTVCGGAEKGDTAHIVTGMGRVLYIGGSGAKVRAVADTATG